MIELFREQLGVGVFSSEFADVFARANTEYADFGVFFLEREYLLRVQQNLNAYPRTLEAVLQEADRLKKDPDAALYALFVYRAMECRALFLKHLSLFTFPEKYPLFAFLCLIPAMETTYRILTARNLPADIVEQTIGQYEDCVFLHQKRFDEYGLHKRYFDHLQLYVDGKILNLGRMRFEMCRLDDPVYVLRHRASGELTLLFGAGEMRSDGLYRDTPPVTEEGGFTASFQETETAYIGHPVSADGKCGSRPVSLLKENYELLMKPGDTCLGGHLTDRGALDAEACRESYLRAVDIFRTYYPEFKIHGLKVHTWLLAPELEQMLSANSRILAFGKQYILYPIHTEGKDVLNFVFNLRFKTYQDLPEDTSLQRNLKKLYLSGGLLYEYGGIFADWYVLAHSE